MPQFKRPLKGTAPLLSALLDSAGGLISTYDMSFRFTAFNAAFRREFERIAGHRIEVGMSLLDALPPSSAGRATVLEFARRAYNGEEFTVTAEFGELPRRCYENRVSPIRDNRGRQIGVLNVIREVTGNGRIERMLNADSERVRLEAIVNSINEGIVLVEPWGDILYVNPTALAQHDLASIDDAKRLQAAWGEHFETRYLDGRLVDTAEWPLKAAIRCQTLSNVEILIRNQRTGRSWVASYNTSPCRDATGEIQFVVLEIRDITKRRIVEQALRESEERFRNMADTAPVMIWVAGPDKLCTFVNKGWLVFTGRPLERELGRGWIENVHPDDLDHCRSTYSESFDARRSFRMEYRLRRADGEYRWVLDGGVPRYEPGGAFVGYIGSCLDITDLKRTQEEALAMQKLESVGVLASGIAHDFNNLLGSIVADTELALSGLAPGMPAMQEIERIKAVALRASEIVRQLMIYSGQETAKLEPVDLSRLVGEMLELIKVSISKHAVLRTDLATGLPAVEANAAQIRQVVMNLVTNASEALGELDGVIHVSTAEVTLPEGRRLRLEVSDTGCGMTSETRARIFDPFFTTKFAGRGLGLAVVQGIVRNHGGFIHLASAPGRGTKCQIFLPCSNQQALEEPASPAAAPRSLQGAVATILMVEDEETIRLTVGKMLRRRGFSVIEAADGGAAIDLLRAHSSEIGAVLLDITVPGASSREVFEEARRLRRDIKVILTTAYSRQIATSSLDWPHIDGFIRKPYQIDDLVRLLQDALAG